MPINLAPLIVLLSAFAAAVPSESFQVAGLPCHSRGNSLKAKVSSPMALSLPPALALWAIAFPMAPPLPPDPPAPRVDLCEIVKDPQRFAGKLIRTEGEVFLGMGALGNKQCPPMRTGAHVWPPAVHLAGPPHKELDAAIAAASRSNTRLCASITGTLRAKDKYLVAQTPSGPMGMGFGHLSIYPAQLEIVSATVQPGCPRSLPWQPRNE